MTDPIISAQIRGARGMLDWSMLDLAKAAGVSVSTVKRLEGRDPQPPSTSIRGAVKEALEAAGIRFIVDERYGVGIGIEPR